MITDLYGPSDFYFPIKNMHIVNTSTNFIICLCVFIYLIVEFQTFFFFYIDHQLLFFVYKTL